MYKLSVRAANIIRHDVGIIENVEQAFRTYGSQEFSASDRCINLLGTCDSA